MSYHVLIVHRDLQELLAEDEDCDAKKWPPLDQEKLATFRSRLLARGYVVESEGPIAPELIRHVGTCPIQVSLYKTEISFAIPFWAGSEEAIQEAVEDALDLSDDIDEWVVYDPQDEEWIA